MGTPFVGLQRSCTRDGGVDGMPSYDPALPHEGWCKHQHEARKPTHCQRKGGLLRFLRGARQHGHPGPARWRLRAAERVNFPTPIHPVTACPPNCGATFAQPGPCLSATAFLQPRLNVCLSQSADQRCRRHTKGAFSATCTKWLLLTPLRSCVAPQSGPL